MGFFYSRAVWFFTAIFLVKHYSFSSEDCAHFYNQITPFKFVLFSGYKPCLAFLKCVSFSQKHFGMSDLHAYKRFAYLSISEIKFWYFFADIFFTLPSYICVSFFALLKLFLFLSSSYALCELNFFVCLFLYIWTRSVRFWVCLISAF